MRVYRVILREPRYTRDWSKPYGRSILNYGFIAVILLTLLLDIALVYGIYRLALTFW